MSLKEYERKRHFDATPEPPPVVSDEAGRRFCVQRHHASRLHYDFRLEHAGVLVSWAIPRGPSLDPKNKRQAAHVEDHPVDYLTFEGVIPHGNYGAGSVMLWDLGTYTVGEDGDFDKQFERGNLKLIMDGHRLKGAFAFVRMQDGKNWLLIKKKDAFAVPAWDVEDHARSVASGLSQAEIARGMTGASWSSKTGREPDRAPVERPEAAAMAVPAAARTVPMPRNIEPMLPFASKPFSDPHWMFELKWDGVRAIAYIADDRVTISSRRGNSIVRQYPELEALHLNVAAGSCILDGEIVALDEQGLPQFERLQPRLHASVAQALTLSRRTPVTYYVFDLLYLNGHDLRALPFRQRRDLLKAVLRPDATVRLSDVVEGDGELLYKLADERGLEGVMAKHEDSRYEETRSARWLKIKKTATVDAVIGGYTTPREGARQNLGAVVLGLYENDRLVPIGQAGSGFNAQSIQRLLNLFNPLQTDQCPFQPCPKPSDPVVWLQPRLVCEVKYNVWTSDRKLRGPVFLRLRDDKDPSECVFESDSLPAEPRALSPGYTQLLSDHSNKQTLQIDGRTLTFTNLDKVMYPQDGVTKRDLLNFYDRISPYLLPYLHDHPLNLKRYPNGIEAQFFFQRHATEKFPAWLTTTRIVTSDGEEEEVFVANDRPTLLYLVNLGCLDQNMWLSKAGSLDEPDFLLLDLDPVEGCTVDTLVAGANALHEVLQKLGLRGYPKTSGGRGMHIWVPLQRRYTFDQTRMLAQVMGHLAAQRHPKVFSFNRVVEKREKGRVYLDAPQNRRGSSIAAPYVLRAFPGAAVATPLAWDEMKPGLDPKAFNIRTMFDRLDKVGDLFRPVLEDHQSLEAAIAALES